MSQFTRSLPILILTLVFIGVTAVNAAAQLAILSGGPGDREGQVVESQEAETVENELDEDIGGMTQVTSIPVGAVTLAMAAISVGLLMGRRWALTGAIVALGFDMVLKAINIVVELTAGSTFSDLLPAIAMIMVEGVLLFGFNHYRHLFKDERQPMERVEQRVT
jgi:hypothetical protein